MILRYFPLFLMLIFIQPRFAVCQVVETNYGRINGTTLGGVYRFLGIPFARPPLGDLRWKAPVEPMSWDSILETKSFAPVCPQKRFDPGNANGEIVGNEDCLYLNIWTPQIQVGRLPVLVFIHGGGNQQGGAADFKAGTYMFDGNNMAQRGSCVVVTLQYRLGPLGFMVHGGLEAENQQHVSGNYAIMDQILALKWVKDNIAKFGGDPEKVMIFGESAGGVDVGNLLTTPQANQLFQRACIQSAVPVIVDYKVMKDRGIEFVNKYITGGSDTDKINFMRSLPASELVKDQTSPLEGGVVGLEWLSVIDGLVFNNLPDNIFQSSQFNKVPLIIGSNEDEMSLNAPQTVTPGTLTLFINSTVPAPYRQEALLYYPPGNNNNDARKSWIDFLTDSQFTSTTRRTARCVSANQNEPVWRYFFTHKHGPAALKSLGSYHGMELFYVFNNWENTTFGSGPLFTTADDAVQKLMLEYWVNFADTGNPNRNGLPDWPRYNRDCYLNINKMPDGSSCGLRTEVSDFWDKVMNYIPCSSTNDTDDTALTYKLDIYPNPSSGYFYIIQNLQLTFSVYDINGKKVDSKIENGRVDLNGQPDGMYFIMGETDHGRWVGRAFKF